MKVKSFPGCIWKPVFASFCILASFNTSLAENVDPDTLGLHWSWSENAGWLDAEPNGNGGQGNNRFEDLDPAQRDAILRANEENQGVPAEFDALLAEYYQRLAAERALTAEEQDAGDE